VVAVGRGEPTDVATEISVAVRAMLQTGREMHVALARHLRIGETDLAAMDHLVASPNPLGPVELGHRLGIRSASATVLVDRLAAAGHLTRDQHPADRRRVTLHPTQHARVEIRQALTPLLTAISEITGRLDPEQAQAVLAFLTDVTGALHDFAEAEH
jgi:DNA-binding MarR family transcriptional regulator